MQIYKIAEEYNYQIKSESSNFDYYTIEIYNDKNQIDFSFKLGSDDQYNYFDILFTNPTSFDEILKITNEFSRKEFTEKFYYNVINNDNLFYNHEKEEYSTYNDEYNFFKIDYIGISEDYCLSYYAYTDGEKILTLSGFTK